MDEVLQVLSEGPLQLSAFIAATNHLNFEDVLSAVSKGLILITAPVCGPEIMVRLNR